MATPASNVVEESSQEFSSCETEILTSDSGAVHAESERNKAATPMEDNALLVSNLLFFLDC